MLLLLLLLLLLLPLLSHFFPMLSSALTCTQGAIRIVGTTGYSGRLEVCNDNQWGTVCDDFFSTFSATVACRQLGFNPAGSRVLSSRSTPNGRGTIWLDNVRCNGNETTIFNCPKNLLGNHNCNHGEDVGVTCNRGKVLYNLLTQPSP